jgi:hypothetical protein
VRIWRNKQLVVERSGDETLVLDVAGSRVHRLNADGLAVMDATANGPGDVGPGLHDAAGELVDAGVLHTDSWSRRRFIGRTVGAAIVATVLLPTATAAASTESFVGPAVLLTEEIDDDDGGGGQVMIRAEWDAVTFPGNPPDLIDLNYVVHYYFPLIAPQTITAGRGNALDFEFEPFDYSPDPPRFEPEWTVYVVPYAYFAQEGGGFKEVEGAPGPEATITVTL